MSASRPSCEAGGWCCAPCRRPTSRRGGRSASATGAGCSSGSPSRRRARPTTPRAGPPSSPAAAPGSGSGRWAPATASGSSSAGSSPGEINLSGVQRGPFQNAYVGYWIDEAQAGNGYVPEALVVAARFAFEELGLHRLQVAIIPRNRASRRVVGEARPAGGGHRPPLPGHQRRVGGPHPLRPHRRGLGQPPPPSSSTRGSATSPGPSLHLQAPEAERRAAYR